MYVLSFFLLLLFPLSALAQVSGVGATQPRAFPRQCTHFILENGAGDCSSFAQACAWSLYTPACGNVACHLSGDGEVTGASNIIDSTSLRCPDNNPFVFRLFDIDPSAPPKVVFNGRDAGGNATPPNSTNPGNREPCTFTSATNLYIWGAVCKNSSGDSMNLTRIGNTAGQEQERVTCTLCGGFNARGSGNFYCFGIDGDPDGTDFLADEIWVRDSVGMGPCRKVLQFYGTNRCRATNNWLSWTQFDTVESIGPTMALTSYQSPNCLFEGNWTNWDWTGDEELNQMRGTTATDGHDDLDPPITGATPAADRRRDFNYQVANSFNWTDFNDAPGGNVGISISIAHQVGFTDHDPFNYEVRNSVFAGLNGTTFTNIVTSTCFNSSGLGCNKDYINITAIGGVINTSSNDTQTRIDAISASGTMDLATNNIFLGPQCEDLTLGNGACLCWQTWDGQPVVGMEKYPYEHKEFWRGAVANAGYPDDPYADTVALMTNGRGIPANCSKKKLWARRRY